LCISECGSGGPADCYVCSVSSADSEVLEGGVEAIYDDMAAPIGFARFAQAQAASGAMFSARRRAARPGPLTVAPVISEAEYYGETTKGAESSSTHAA
jgi:hypothetical protein